MAPEAFPPCWHEPSGRSRPGATGWRWGASHPVLTGQAVADSAVAGHQAGALHQVGLQG